MDIQSCVEHVSDKYEVPEGLDISRSHSSFRKGLQAGIAHDVEEVEELGFLKCRLYRFWNRVFFRVLVMRYDGQSGLFR